VKSQNQKKITPQKGLKSQNSFTISNAVIQLPDYLDKEKILSKNGIKIISASDGNTFPQQVAKLAKESSTLKAVINSFSEYVSYGTISTDNLKLETKLKEDLNKHYDWYELIKRVTKDRRTYGYGFIEEVRIGKDVFVYHLDANKVRFVEYEGEFPEAIAISKDWTDSKIKPVERTLYPHYQENEIEIDGKTLLAQTRIIPIIEYESGSSDYPLPIWSGAFYDVQIESLIGQYNCNQFENGISISSMLMFDFGDVTDDEELKKEKYKLEQHLQGTSGGRSGKSLIVPKTGDVEKPEYTVYPMDKEGSWLDLIKSSENNIVKACSWFRSLTGLESAGSLGNNQQLRNEWELAERSIRNEQIVVYGAIKKAFEGTSYEGEVTFSNASPISLVDGIDINNVLSLEEKRLLFGLEIGEKEESKVALNGAQVTSLVEVVSKIATGELTEAQAVQIIKIALGITEEEAKQIVKK
jgi:hypothetical protein